MVSQLNSYAIAVLGLAAHAVGDDPDARKLLVELDHRASMTAASHSGPDKRGTTHGKSDPLETTAYALRFEWTMNPQSPRDRPHHGVPHRQDTSGWAATTKDTAAIVYALSEILPPQNQELAPHEKVAIWIDHRLARTISVDAAELDAANSQLVVAANDVRDGSLVQIGRVGAGTLYWSGAYQRYAPAGCAFCRRRVEGC